MRNKLYRISKTGENVTDKQDQWLDSDYEIVATNFGHPSITTGMHTNGPATVWVREIGGEWLCTFMCAQHKVRQELVENGLENIKCKQQWLIED